jgi:GWxTD domain-containing protein
MSIRSLLLGLSCAAGLAAPASAQPALPIQLDVDHAAFRWTADSTLVETYLAVGASGLDYAADPAGFRASLEVVVAMRRAASASAPDAADRSAVLEDTLALAFIVPDTSRLHDGQFFVQQQRWAVPAGEYQLDVTIPGTADRPEVRLQQDVLAPAFADDGQARLSTLALASSIRRSDEAGDPFYKNGLSIRPNPNALYGEGLPRLTYYAEAYGVDDAVPDGQYTLYAYVAAANLPQPIEGLQQRKRRPARSVDVLVGQFDVSELPSGAYYLRVALLDRDNAALAEDSRKFFVVNPSVRAAIAASDAPANYEAALYQGMNEEELDEQLTHARVLATGTEEREMKELGSVEAKRTYLVRFWGGRDTNPATPVNEARRTFYERLQYVNERYGNSFTEGYESDRGRVALKYGLPSNVDPGGGGGIEHEIWGYDNIPGEGSATFVFADEQGFGDMRLIHSTVTGEVSLPDWRRRINQN